PDASEGLTNFVWELGAVGVVEEESAAGRARLRAFFPEAADSDAIAKSIDLYLGALESLGFARTGGPAVADVADTDWAEAWRAHLAPLPIGRRLLVAPPWAAPLVLANLLAAAHCALAPCYARLVAAGGTLVAGGCLDAEADDVTAALRGYGFQRLEARSIEGWTTLAYEHASLRDRA